MSKIFANIPYIVWIRESYNRQERQCEENVCKRQVKELIKVIQTQHLKRMTRKKDFLFQYFVNLLRLFIFTATLAFRKDHYITIIICNFWNVVIHCNKSCVSVGVPWDSTLGPFFTFTIIKVFFFILWRSDRLFRTTSLPHNCTQSR